MMIKKKNISQPLVSIVITTKNEEANLPFCLESLRHQDYPKRRMEVIVVDNNSTDRTKAIARRFGAQVVNIGPERSAQRNYGLKIARGKYALFLDADMILSHTVISQAVAKAEKQSLVALYVPEIVLGTSFWSEVRRFERSFYDGTVVDAVRFLRRHVFLKTGKIRQTGKVAVLCKYNFEEINKKLKRIEISGNMVAKGDRNSLVKLSEIKKLMNLIKEPVIYHNEADFNLMKYLKKKRYYSRSFDKYIKKWGKNNPDIKRQLGLWYRYGLVFWENGKWRRFLRHPFLVAGMYFLRAMVGVVFIFSKKKK